MNFIDGGVDSVRRAALWTIDELLHEREKKPYSVLRTYFTETDTFDLYQEPTHGWFTKDPLKLGSKAQKMTFAYCCDTDPMRIELQTCDNDKPLSLTAIKTALVTMKILSACMYLERDYPQAQPLSWHENDFPIIGAYIYAKDLKSYRDEEKLNDVIENLSPADCDISFVIGRTHQDVPLEKPGNTFSVGDLVVVKRTKVSPTFGKVMKAEKNDVQIAVENNPGGRVYSFKQITSANRQSNILGHWGAKESKKDTPPLKRKRSDSQSLINESKMDARPLKRKRSED